MIDRERKEIIALLIEDVTIMSEHTEITAHVRLRGGACRTLTLPRSTVAPRQRTPPHIVAQIDRLLELGDDDFVAQNLNAAGIRNWRNCSFTKGHIANVRKGRSLPSHRKHRDASGYTTAGELAARYNVTRTTIRHWAQTRSPARRGVCAGETTSQMWPASLICRYNPYPHGPDS